MEAQDALREFEAAVKELEVELTRLTSNVRDVTQYQAQVFRVTKVLCSWMENIDGLARHRAPLDSPPDSSR